MDIGDLIRKLQEIKESTGDLRVGFTGYCGEFYELEEGDVRVVVTRLDGNMERITRETVLKMTMPDIGPEPD